MNKRLFSYVILALLFLSLIPLFSPSVGATTDRLGNGGLGTYNNLGVDAADWAQMFGGTIGPSYIGSGQHTDFTTTTGYLTNSITGNYPITSVKVTLGCRGDDSINGDAQQKLYTHSTLYTGNTFALDGTGVVVNSYTWNTNPFTLAAWTKAEIDALETGVALKQDAPLAYHSVLCGEIWTNVTYTPSITPITSSVTSITETGATFIGTTTYGSTAMTCGFWYNTTGTNTNVTCAGTYNYGETFSKTVTDLKPGYYYNVTAWSLKAGIGMFYSTTILHFLAKPYAPSLTHSVATGNNITVSWTNFTKATGTTRYTMVRYSTVTYPTTIASGTLLINTTTVNTTSINYYTPGTYYFSYWTFVYQGTYNAWSTTYNTSILVAPTKPSNLAVTSFTNNSIYLSWTKGTGNTVITRNTTTYPSAPDNGVKVYNSTLEVFTDTGLLPSHKYYYRAWNWNGTAYSPGYTNVSQYTRPNKPYSLNYHLTSTSINITWLNGTGSQRTVIRESTTAQPVLPTDGTLLYNGTAHYKVDTTFSGSYYTLFSYNTTTNLYSAYAPLTWYAVIINCYNESSGLTIAGYNVFFTNPDGTDTYEATGCTNPYLVNVSDIPQGASISILVNATGYYSRTYVKNIVISGNYYFSAYLIPLSTATLYYLRVVETIDTGYGETDRAVESANVTVKRYINATVGYQTISDLITDANGYVNIQLLPYIQYKVFLSKTGYDNAISDYIPALPNEWGQTVEKTFRLVLSADVVIPPVYMWDDYITFTGRLDNTTVMVYANYTDALTNTTNWQLYLYQIDPNGTTPILITSWSDVTDSFNLDSVVPGATDVTYVLVLCVNHSNFGFNRLTIYLFGYHHGITSAARFNLLFTLNYGYNPFGWANTIFFFIILGCFFMTDRKNTYMSVFAIGFILLFVNFYIGIETVWSGIAGGFWPILLIFFGILMLVRDRGYSGAS
jgi:hypothetical protein